MGGAVAGDRFWDPFLKYLFMRVQIQPYIEHNLGDFIVSLYF